MCQWQQPADAEIQLNQLNCYILKKKEFMMEVSKLYKKEVRNRLLDNSEYIW